VVVTPRTDWRIFRALQSSAIASQDSSMIALPSDSVCNALLRSLCQAENAGPEVLSWAVRGLIPEKHTPWIRSSRVICIRSRRTIKSSRVQAEAWSWRSPKAEPVSANHRIPYRRSSQAIDAGHESVEAGDVVPLAWQEHEADQIAERIDDHSDLRRQAAARFTDGLILSPPFAPVPC
jgi:hypothetical protein